MLNPKEGSANGQWGKTELHIRLTSTNVKLPKRSEAETNPQPS